MPADYLLPFASKRILSDQERHKTSVSMAPCWQVMLQVRAKMCVWREEILDLPIPVISFILGQCQNQFWLETNMFCYYSGNLFKKCDLFIETHIEGSNFPKVEQDGACRQSHFLLKKHSILYHICPSFSTEYCILWHFEDAFNQCSPKPPGFLPF